VDKSFAEIQAPLTEYKPIFLPNATATLQLGIQLGKLLSAGSVLLLKGNLGSGKTTLIQGLAQGLEVQDTIESPTFTLINEYLNGRVPLYHFDLYRLSSAEAVALNVELYWEGLEVDLGIVAIEWAEKLTYKPDCYLELHLTYSQQEGRIASFFPVGAAAIAAFAQLNP